MITNFKIYESTDYPAIQFQDEYLIVHKVTEGPNKGLIKFKVYEESSERYSITYSMLYGAAFLLDSKYETNEQIRNIKLENIAKFRKVNDNTIDAIIFEFLKDIGYSKDKIERMRFDSYHSIKELNTIFFSAIKEVAKYSKNIGEVFDGLRRIRDGFFYYEKPYFDEWKLKNNQEKYNL
jgi:uncharacterized protein YpbB